MSWVCLSVRAGWARSSAVRILMLSSPTSLGYAAAQWFWQFSTAAPVDRGRS